MPREYEEPVALVRGADGRRRNTVPLRIVPARGKVSENSLQPPSKERCHVLHDDEARSYQANDPGHLGPETRVLAVDPDAPAGVADVGARESAADDIDIGNIIRDELAYIFVPLCFGPMTS